MFEHKLYAEIHHFQPSKKEKRRETEAYMILRVISQRVEAFLWHKNFKNKDKL